MSSSGETAVIAPPTRMQDAGPVLVTYAGFWRRFWALVLDVLFLWMLGWLLATALPPDAATGPVVLLIALYLVGTTAGGGSVGKRMLSLRVVRADDGRPLGVVRAVVREMMRIPSLLVVAGALWMLDGRQRQTWHDSLAGSVVVREHPLAASPAWAAVAPWAGAD